MFRWNTTQPDYGTRKEMSIPHYSNHSRHSNGLMYKDRFFFLITNYYARKLSKINDKSTFVPSAISINCDGGFWKNYSYFLFTKYLHIISLALYQWCVWVFYARTSSRSDHFCKLTTCGIFVELETCTSP